MGYVGDIFFKWGFWAAGRPLVSIFIGLVIVIIGTTGFINSQTTVSICHDFMF